MARGGRRRILLANDAPRAVDPVAVGGLEGTWPLVSRAAMIAVMMGVVPVVPASGGRHGYSAGRWGCEGCELRVTLRKGGRDSVHSVAPDRRES